MIMNKFCLKIAVFAVLALGAIIVANPFWSAETQILKEGEGDLEAQDAGAVKLYQEALFYKESSNPRHTRYKLVADCCQQILKKYPDSLLAKKARELLQEVPERYRKQYSSPDLNKPKVRKSRSLRRRM